MSSNKSQDRLDVKIELSKMLEEWESVRRTSNADVCPILDQIAKLMEEETESFYRSDPDPFDVRHPLTVKPDCSLGGLLEQIHDHKEFINKLTSYVMTRENIPLQTSACRLLYVLLNCVRESDVFKKTTGLIEWLFQRAESAEEPLRSYAIGLLGSAMEDEDIATTHKDANMHLNPILQRRLRELANSESRPPSPHNDTVDHKHHHYNNNTSSIPASPIKASDEAVFERPFAVVNSNSKRLLSPEHNGSVGKELNQAVSASPVWKKRRISSPNSPANSWHTESNSSWAELEPLIVGSFCLHPLTREMQLRFILQYLCTMGNYQELLYHVLEVDGIGLILQFIDLKPKSDIRLAFEALKYLSSLLCHKKISLEFLNRGGLQTLLQVDRPSVAATGVSLCLYYLACSDDAMERICQMPKPVLEKLVEYSMWLLERSHDSSKCHAIMFYAHSFAFRVILDIFDNKDEADGLRKLLNAMFILNLFDDKDPETQREVDELVDKRQIARQICFALKKYFEAHLVIESDRVRRLSQSGSRSSSSSSNPSHPERAVRPTAEKIAEHIETLLEANLSRPGESWRRAVNELIDLGGVKHIITLVAVSPSWSFQNETELMRSCLDILVIVTVAPRVQIKLREKVVNMDGEEVVGMSVILAFLETEECSGQNSTKVKHGIDPHLTQAALRIIINCVCGPNTSLHQPGKQAGATATPHARHASGSALNSSRKKTFFKSDHMWKCVQDCDGIGILLDLLKVTMPMTEADSIRALACRALCGLCNCEDIRQIVAKRPIINTGMLQALTREPVLQDKHSEFVKFKQYCRELIHRVTGAPISNDSDLSLENLNRAEIVSQTRILFDEKQLHQLLYDYCMAKGFTETADILSREANLNSAAPEFKPDPWPRRALPALESSDQTSTLSSTAAASVPFSQFKPLSNEPVLNSSQTSVSSYSSATAVPSNSSQQGVLSCSSPLPMIGKRRSLVTRHKIHSPLTSSITPSSGCMASPFLKRFDSINRPKLQQQKPSLVSIITESLRQQHSVCKAPIATCPPFDLLTPHRCPEPKRRRQAPGNMAMRVCQKQIFPKYGGQDGLKMDRKYIYSRFRPVRTFKEAEDAQSFTACAFSHNTDLVKYGDEGFLQPYLFLGTNTGDLACFNPDSGHLVATYNCHDTDITYIEPSRDGRSIITCSIWRSPVSALWSFTDVFEIKTPFEDDFHVEFGKMCQDKAVGTRNSAANLYDLNTGMKVATFHETVSKKYFKNQATFNYTDELILNDGVLWDVRNRTPVHRFDKFNTKINGVFHPNGWDIIANTDIWDMRTFRLLRTVPALNQCRIKFNSTGDVIYGGQFAEESSEDDELALRAFGSSFRTFDATDYSSIATIDIKRNIYDLAVDTKDNYIAIIEQAAKAEFNFSAPDNICRLYEVGRSIEDDEKADDDEEEEDGHDMDDSDDDDDDDDLLDATDDFGHFDSEGSVAVSFIDSDSDSNDSDESDDESDDDEEDDDPPERFDEDPASPDGEDNSDDYEDIDSDEDEDDSVMRLLM